MPLKDGAYIRRERLKRISREIARQFGKGAKKISFSGSIVWIQTEIGLSYNKAVEYLELVLSSHNWENNEGSIIISESEAHN